MRFILLEDIAAVRKNYPKISDEDFNQLIRLDPTFDENRDSVGTYGKWILTLFNKGKLDRKNHVTDILSRFENNKKQLKNKDINTFKSIEDLENYLNDDNNYKDLSHRQEVRQRQQDRKNSDLTNEADLVFNGSEWEVWTPKTYAASCKLGQGSSWCTASTESDYYYNHYTSQGPLFIVLNKSNKEEKYQFHFETFSFMDINDSSINLFHFLQKEKELQIFFFPHIIKAYHFPSELTSFDDEITMVFDDADLNDILSETAGDGRYTVPGDVAYDILCNGWSDLDFFDYFEIEESNILAETEHLLTSKNKELIQSRGADDEEVIEVLGQALGEARLAGTRADAYRDAKKSLLDCFSVSNLIATFSDGKLTVEGTVWNILELENDIDFMDMSMNYSNELRNMVAELIITQFELREPQYGWNGFDEELFNEIISQSLN